ncbi:RNA polymerase sigma-I factor [Alkaliphilus crotonatoxidans]
MTNFLRLFKTAKTLEERVKLIQEGNQHERNQLIKEYIPFIQKHISQQLGKYIDTKNSDLYSIGLMAFNEAIDKYNEKKGSFLNFAAVVMKSRVIDQLRREARNNKVVYMSQLFGVEEKNSIEEMLVEESFENRFETKLDMAFLIEKMKAYNVTLDDLLLEAPKHIDTRLRAIEVAKYVYEVEPLRKKFIRTQNLPMTDLMRELGISKKVVQRSRKFIIAVILILESDLDTLKGYINEVERREVSEI